jgi:hypothetical protein
MMEELLDWLSFARLYIVYRLARGEV